MERKPITGFFAALIRQLIRIRGLLAVLLILIFLPTFLTHLVLWRIEHRLGVHIQNKPFFILIPGHIYFNPASLNWQDNVAIQSGALTVRYPLSAYILPEFNIGINGKNLKVEFKPKFQKIAGNGSVLFERISALIRVKPHGKMDVLSLDAESDTLNFHLKSENK
jgi:hypothetical protein